MTHLGCCLTSELHGPRELVEHARLAEEAGFRFALISDHYHPWISKQGHSPFVWSVIGGIAARTNELTLGTGVTCPTVRIHPAIVAQAVATPNGGLSGELSQELPMPGHFQQASSMVSPEELDETVACGPDPDRHMEMLKRFEDAGYTHLYVHQIGPDQQGFLDFYEREILPNYS